MHKSIKIKMFYDAYTDISDEPDVSGLDALQSFFFTDRAICLSKKHDIYIIIEVIYKHQNKA